MRVDCGWSNNCSIRRVDFGWNNNGRIGRVDFGWNIWFIKYTFTMGQLENKEISLNMEWKQVIADKYIRNMSITKLQISMRMIGKF